ncbi:MAG: hypothetical protein SPL86_03205 [Succiniclasticum sp.]|uniref:hypothetical protein n=1 Tax=Succiniclasticum sp. TaxID=2775030 RepID=UPI002A91281A|nr:hypothetical protein [Succiniclasticum sp.]MDY6290471.1 hypothetical protein [Succiniclasticum sp.]
MNGRVIKCDGETVTIGMNDGSFKVVSYRELGFRADVNDEVDIYVNNMEKLCMQKLIRKK